MPTTPHGLYYPEDTVNVSPLHPVLAAMQTSMDDYLDENPVIHPIANTAGRAALIAEYPPTTATPLFIWRADAPAGQNLEVTTNGTTWTSIGANPTSLTYNTQTLTDPQKAQARSNIDAWSTVTGILNIVTDLNTVNTAGHYIQTTTPTIGLNYPVLISGWLEIVVSGSYVMQYYTTMEAAPQVFVREFDTATWSAWTKISPTPVAAFPFAKATRNTQQTGLAATTWTRLQGLTLIAGATTGIINTTTGIITIPAGQGGLWAFSGAVTFSTESSTRRMMAIEKGGGTPGSGTSLTRFDVTAGGYVSCSAYTEEYVSAGDQFGLNVYSGSSSSLRGDFNTLWFAARRVQ